MIKAQNTCSILAIWFCKLTKTFFISQEIVSGDGIWYPGQPVDTVGICAVTVAHILLIISAIYLLNCTLVGIKSVIVIDYWDGDRLPTIASNEEA